MLRSRLKLKLKPVDRFDWRKLESPFGNHSTPSV
jgi:hypothetical protein